MKQTAVDFLSESYMYLTWLRNRDEKLEGQADKMMAHYLIEAKEMEKKQRIEDYNAGHADGLCNHINDAENYINEQNYLRDELKNTTH
jgi:hypothetical protein